MPEATPRSRFAAMLAEFSPEVVKVARGTLERLRRRMPGATQLVYDNYYALVVGFGPSERASEAVLSVVIFPKKVSVSFLYGKKLRDPKKLLRGTGKQVRNIQVPTADVLDQRDVVALLEQAIAYAKPPIPLRGPSRLVIRAALPHKRPRRPGVTPPKRRS